MYNLTDIFEHFAKEHNTFHYKLEKDKMALHG